MEWEMRILCVCDFGCTRSVAMANVLRKRNYVADSVGIEDEDGIKFLWKCRDFKPNRIIWMNEGSFPEDGWIGRDTWPGPMNRELIAICEKKADELGLKRNV
jgi:hypothetical protein